LTLVLYKAYSFSVNTPSAQMTKGAEQARQQLPTLLDHAAAGGTTLITRHGRVVAAIVPAELVTRAPVSLLSLAGTGAGLWGGDSAEQIAELRDEWSR